MGGRRMAEGGNVGGEQAEEQAREQTGRVRPMGLLIVPPNRRHVCVYVWLQIVSRVSTAIGITIFSLKVNLKKSELIQKQDSYCFKLLPLAIFLFKQVCCGMRTRK